ncbi:hypothetical protein LRAMOSA08290 [Lichtheimia ramosa]|uniref:Uncharacterized protein n=1 Tax=Lichtheimia ramosa TaxID=688394 RepID=A0A077WGF6_9FUNG|nr:hypothetical protein LRAMOSA08290 [Lichtheimia ramosa]
MVAGSIIGLFLYILHRQRQQNVTKGQDWKDKEKGDVVESSSSTVDTPISSLPPPTTTTFDTPSSSDTTVDAEKLDHHDAQLVLMPLSPRRTHEKITIAKNNASSSSPNDKYRSVLVQQTSEDDNDDATSKRRISLSPFLEGVESPTHLQPPPPVPVPPSVSPPPAPTRSLDTTSSSSNSTLPSSIMLSSTRLGIYPSSSTRLHVDMVPTSWRGPTPPWTIMTTTTTTSSPATSAATTDTTGGVDSHY